MTAPSLKSSADVKLDRSAAGEPASRALGSRRLDGISAEGLDAAAKWSGTGVAAAQSKRARCGFRRRLAKHPASLGRLTVIYGTFGAHLAHQSARRTVEFRHSLATLAKFRHRVTTFLDAPKPLL